MAGQTTATYHTPVMVREIAGLLAPLLGRGAFVDATVGGAGHAGALLEEMARAGTGGVLLGIDVDREAIVAARQRLERAGFAVTAEQGREVVLARSGGRGPRLLARLVKASYVELPGLVRELGLGPVAGVLMDLGVSLHQLMEPDRGFSFDRDGPIDMRFDRESAARPALELLRRSPAEAVKGWLSEYAQEPRSGRIARALHERRRELRTTGDVVRAVSRFAPGPALRTTLARVFQAIRIATNRELETVAAGLKAALDVLMPGGRLAVISYHSGEDRLAKNCLREGSRAGRLRLVLPKPLRPSADEVAANPRARSARLRAAEMAA